MERRHSNHLCLGLAIAGFSTYLVGIAQFGSPLLILAGLLIVITAMSVWAVAGLGRVPAGTPTVLASARQDHPPRKRVPDPMLEESADSARSEERPAPSQAEKEPQHLTSTAS